LYDGDCPLCNRSVQFLLWLDKRGKLVLIPQQSPAARELADCYEWSFGREQGKSTGNKPAGGLDDLSFDDLNLHDSLNSGTVVSANKAPAFDTEQVWLATPKGLYLGAEAAIEALDIIDGWAGILALKLRFWPRSWVNTVYRLVARNRRHLFNPYVCEVPLGRMWRAPGRDADVPARE